MKEALVSIIVPVYKVEKYLRQCLDSIINQTYKNLEIILVDDGSPDNCPQICDEYAKKDKRIKVIHKENGGLSSARNAGLDVCKGEYISFVDSDDLISKDFINILYDVLINANVDIVECGFLKFEDREYVKLLRTNHHCTNNQFDTFTSREMQLKLTDCDYVNHVVVWNKLYKKDMYNKLRFPNGKIHEDEYTTYKVFSNSNSIAIIKEQLYFYRFSESSIMGRKYNVSRLDIIGAYEEKKDFYKDDIEIFDKLVILYQQALKSCYFNTKKFISNNKEAISIIKKRLKSNYKDIKKQKLRLQVLFKRILFFLLSKFILCVGYN